MKATEQRTNTMTNLESEIYNSPMFKRNYDKFGDVDACCCCARPLNENECKRIHINIDNRAMVNTIVTEEDAVANGFISQGYMFIGNSCAKKMNKQFIHA